MKILTMILGILFACSGVFARAQAEDRTTAAGVFTPEQAKNGERIYRTRCAACHGPDLMATDPDAPDLTGDGFMMLWVGKRLSNRFRNIRIAMPEDAPGSLDDQSYIDVIAFVLQFNGNPPGKEKLAPDLESLEQIVIAGP